ncbi:MAG: zinc-dependent peptidase [Spirochaetales bacterium]|nr:zinc-dependent peptidase [Spirochaetales bacterium]
MRLFHGVRRRRLGNRNLLDEESWSWLLEQHPFLTGLNPEELDRLRALTTLFLHDKTFEAAEGFVLEDHVPAVISIQAALPVLNLGLDAYAGWKTVVVVPEGFHQEHLEVDPGGIVREWTELDLGESWDEGPVVLSWEDVEASGWGDGFNVVVHEAAHRLDLTDGAVNGRPALHREMDPQEWHDVFTAAYRDLEQRVRRRRRTAVDSYALENPGEFFAVVSELFFELPRTLEREYREVYRLLAAYYRQDPARRAQDPARRRQASSRRDGSLSAGGQ